MDLLFFDGDNLRCQYSSFIFVPVLAIAKREGVSSLPWTETVNNGIIEYAYLHSVRRGGL
jgi:hypothetical protein